MEATLTFDWANHQHLMYTAIVTHDHYYDEEVTACRLCDRASAQSGIPTNKHFTHPKGCKCYWCAYCKCNELRKREEITRKEN